MCVLACAYMYMYIGVCVCIYVSVGVRMHVCHERGFRRVNARIIKLPETCVHSAHRECRTVRMCVRVLACACMCARIRVREWAGARSN